MAESTRTADDQLVNELLELASTDRADLAIRLVELNARHTEGELSDEQFAEQRAELLADAPA